MMPNITRGGRMAGLVVYLSGPGRANEHTNPQLIAGDELVTFAVPTGKTLSTDDALDIANVLDEPRKMHGTQIQAPVREYDEEQGQYVTTGKKDAHVWHCSLSLKENEGELSAEKWAEIAHDFVERMGFKDPDGEKTSRWAAIHHGASKNGNDHIHIAVQLVREDGTKAGVHNDFKRAQQASNEIEKKHNLVVLASREHEYGISGDKPAEIARAHSQGTTVTDRAELRRRARACLATASTQGEYIKHLHDMGVHVQPRFAKGDGTKIEGYRLALPSTPKEQGGDGRQIWYSPSKLDKSLAWPRVEERFGDAGQREAVTLMHQIRDKTLPQPQTIAKLHDLSPAAYDKLISGKVGPDTMANIYARVSLTVEKSKHGPSAQLSDNFSRVAWSMRHYELPPEVLYKQRNTQQGTTRGIGQARQQWRLATQAGKRDPIKGWLAILQQANRVSRVLTTSNLNRERAQLAIAAHKGIDAAETIRTQRHAELSAKKASSTPSRGPNTLHPLTYTERTKGTRSEEPKRGAGSKDKGTDKGYER